jgi:hypothetical protein
MAKFLRFESSIYIERIEKEQLVTFLLMQVLHSATF